MRRLAPEWLLLPVFLLPILGVAGFVAVARDRHATALEPWRTGVAEAIGERVRDDPGAVERSVARFMERLPPGVPVRMAGVGFRFLMPSDGDGPEDPAPWVLSDAFPSGLGADTLADSGARLRIEQGAAPVDVGPVDEGTRALRSLVLQPDLAALRAAPLPAATKLFLVRKWIRSGAGAPRLAAAEALLVALTDLQREVAARGWPTRTGEHRYGDYRVVYGGPERGIAAYPAGFAPVATTHRLRVPDDDPVTVTLRIPGDAERTAGPSAIWTGWVAGPVAGRWTVASRWGDDWWRSPFVARWLGPAIGGLLLYLVFPTAVLLSIRRRRKLDEARARFVTEIAHDLRTPITSLRLYSEMLASGRAPEDSAEKYVEVLAREATRVSSLLANLLDLSRLERGVREVEMEDVELDDALEPVARDFALQFPDRADDLHVSGADGLKVRADRTALARCLENLLANAGKFTPPGTPIRVRWEAFDGPTVQIFVSDEGPGIPKAERRALFRRFARGERARRDGIPGSGLGLSLVAELAEAMGGEVRHFQPEKGATFMLSLRMVTDDG